MKKSVSLMLALIAVASMTVNAFASDLEPEVPATENAPEIIAETEEVEADAPETAAETEKASPISFGVDAESQKGFDSLLTPGETYQFPIFLADENGEKVQVQDEHLKDHKLRVEGKEGRGAVNSIKIVEGDDGYVLEVVAGASSATKQTTFKGIVKLVKRSNGQQVHSADIAFTVGYGILSNEALDGVKDGEYVYIDESAPVITADQFKKLDRYVEGGKVTFTNGTWTYEVRVTDQGSVNLLNNRRAIKEIAAKFEDNNFKFLSFPWGPGFDFTGKLTIDVSEEMEDFDGKFHAYSYYKGKLSKVNASFDKEEETLSFNTKNLGCFVISDKEIANNTIVEEIEDKEDDTKPNGGSSTSKPNPGMGAGSFGGVAAAAAAFSAAALGLLFKKRS